MANTTNPEAWAAQERLRFVERSLYWRAAVKRRDLGEGFGISLAQASADLQRYFEMNPAAARYDTSAKCYRGEPGMRCVLHEPRLEEAMAFFLPGGETAWPPPPAARAGVEGGSPVVARLDLPAREASPVVQRAAFLAVMQGLRLRVHYGSLTGRGGERWRWIEPHAFGHDGYRWHARAWCEENDEYRDFVLSRIAKAEWPAEAASAPGPDEEWERWETLRFVVNSELDEVGRRSVERDFCFEDGILELRVRAAMKPYLHAHLRLPWEGVDRPPFIVPET